CCCGAAPARGIESRLIPSRSAELAERNRMDVREDVWEKREHREYSRPREFTNPVGLRLFPAAQTG
ncbi:MAG: hypothetical protein ACI9F9_000875, partial [Candidatus Paceibacteria bacterium]